MRPLLHLAALFCLALPDLPAMAGQAGPEAWPILPEAFPSTGGGGWMIGEYRPQLLHDRCVSGFTATGPDGQVFRNIVVFVARAEAGGVLCSDGHWAAADGSARGTTPLQVFLKDGTVRGFTPAD